MTDGATDDAAGAMTDGLADMKPDAKPDGNQGANEAEASHETGRKRGPKRGESEPEARAKARNGASLLGSGKVNQEERVPVPMEIGVAMAHAEIIASALTFLGYPPDAKLGFVFPFDDEGLDLGPSEGHAVVSLFE
jgi:hypothetical protein